MIVVDASVVVPALADDEDAGDHARARLRGEDLAAPSLIDLEVVSAWRRLVAGGALTPRRAEVALTDLTDLPMDRVSHLPLLDRCWELRGNVTIYDGAYVALAELLGATLVTADRRLANAPGIACAVELIS